MMKVILILSLVLQHNNSERILGVFYFPSRSHHILGSTLMKGLASRGHEVTMISPFAEKNSHNYQHVELTGMMEIIQNSSLYKVLLNDYQLSTVEKLNTMRDQIGKLEEFALNHTSIQGVLSSGAKFDLVVLVYFGGDAFLGIANKLKALSVLFSPLGSSAFTNKITGNSAPLSYVPNKFLSLPDKMLFFERVTNFVSSLMYEFYCFVVNASNQEYFLRKYFPNSPNLQELRDNVSLILLHSHFSTETPRPYLPNMIQVGGLHIKDNNPLTEEYQNFMDSAENGVILFSLGSNIKSSFLPSHILNAIASTFAQLPQKVLWKFESDLNVTNNVKIAKWLPQNDILAHPNLRLFITHGGSLSMTEGIYHGVPIVAIPIFGDQGGNAMSAINKGYGVQLELGELTEESFTKAIKEILDNPSYKFKTKAASRIIKDQPMKPLDTAIYWVEYILRHKGARHLKSSAAKLSWYQYYLLDVLGLILAILATFVLLVGFILNSCIKAFTTYKHKNAKSGRLIKCKTK